MAQSRRDFTKSAMLGPFLGATNSGSRVILPALVAAELPAFIVLPRALVEQAVAAGACVIERRIYADAVVFESGAITPLAVEGTTYLFAFASLEARQREWDRWNANYCGAVARVREMSLYGVGCGGGG